MFIRLAIFFGSLAVLLSTTTINAYIAVPSLFIVYQLLGGWKLSKLFYYTFFRDLNTIIIRLGVKYRMKKLLSQKLTIPKLFTKTAAKFPNRTAIQMVNGPSMTFQELEDHSNRIANLFRGSDCNLHPQDSVVVFMLNRVERNRELNLQIAKLKTDVSEVEESLPEDLLLYCCSDFETKDTKIARTISLSSALSAVSPRLTSLYDCDMKDPLLYIYTSGTTGMPKAAIVNHIRFFSCADSTYYHFRINSKDIYYCSLPLYHSNGGILGVGNMLMKGNPIVVREKFSASNLFKDCAKYNCTVVQYIGEVCRYLLAQPENPAVDKGHRVRLAFGNGLRPSIWKEFQERFNIERIGEFYGSTEGNVGLVNNDNTMGKVGFVTRLFSFFYTVKLIKVDIESGQPIRDKNGMCIFCQPGESGVLVGQISKDLMRQYNGYLCKKSTSKAVIQDVFRRGDSAFISGDLFEMDDNGYMTFLDRLGDTYRWRGENVSTLEVETAIQTAVGLSDTAVYGIEISGIEGKAGMVAIAGNQKGLELSDLYTLLCKKLPVYARPIFVRFLQNIETTGTFKHKKTELKKQGFNPSLTSDKLYYLDSKRGYLPIDQCVYDDICNGTIRL